MAYVSACLCARERAHEPSVESVFLPPALLRSLESRPIEEVVFLRDELANLAWAVERLIESPTDRPLNRFEAYLEQQRRRELETEGEISSAPKALRYRLSTGIPDYWIPLMPVRVGQGLRLQRGDVLKMDGSRGIVQALGRILESNQDLSLFEEEVPREGIRVKRSFQLTRWIDGSYHLWVGRRKDVGRGERLRAGCGSTRSNGNSEARAPRAHGAVPHTHGVFRVPGNWSPATRQKQRASTADATALLC